MLSFSDIVDAREKLSPYLTDTPVRNYKSLDDEIGEGVRAFVKHENHLPTNSFKYRNGLSAVIALSKEQKQRGVIATTLGNHGQGVAIASTMLGIKSKIYVPLNNNPEKNEAIRNFGGMLVEAGEDYSETIRIAEAEALENNLVMIHSFTNQTVCAGAGTLSLEMLKQIPDLDALVLSVGGGSHAVGAIIVARKLNPKIRIYGVQAEQAPAVHDSWHAGRVLKSKKNHTFADGIRVTAPAGFGFEVLREGLTDFITVSEFEIANALRMYIRNTHNLCEGAAAAGLAGLLKLRKTLAGKKVGLVLTGSNIDQKTLLSVLNEKNT